MNTIRAFVTATGCASVGEQILKALRLSCLPFHLTAADCDPCGTGGTLADDFCPLPRATQANYAEMLHAACRAHHADVLFVGSEAELLAAGAARNEFARDNILLPIQPDNVLRLCLDKALLYEALDGMGFPTPWHRRVRSLADLDGHPPFPLVCKPSKQSGGSSDVYIMRHQRELRFFTAYLLDLHGEFVVQEYVGTPEEEYTVGVLHDMKGTCMGSIGLRRNLRAAFSRRLRVANTTGRAELGDQLVISSGISQGMLGAFPAVCRPCEEIAAALGGTGPMNIQCRLFQGRICLLEINPRFSGTTSLRALGGWNEPELLVRRHLLGQTAKPEPYADSLLIGRRLEEVIIPNCQPSKGIQHEK